MPHEQTGQTLSTLLAIAWLLPLFGFAIEIFAGFWQRDRFSKAGARLAVACIAVAFLCSGWALLTYINDTGWNERYQRQSEHHAALMDSLHGHHAGEDAHHPADDGHDAHQHEHKHGEKAQFALSDPPLAALAPGQDAAEEGRSKPATFSGTYYRLAKFGDLEIEIGYYIDTLTLVMFTMVTFIAMCIHIFAMGYMADELTDEYVDHHAHLADGKHLHRPGRYYQFFAYLSLFCFSMLGLVIAGNIFQVFVFWELVGICSYFLIGFYFERKSASNAANKAFIMNRVGDFGFLIGLMVLWTSFGTFKFAETDAAHPEKPAGLFQMARGADGLMHIGEDADGTSALVLHERDGSQKLDAEGNPVSVPYWLIIVAGLGIFAGCIGKSAQFPLQTWLPDAMEGPTPVSALVHSATMVAAGVYLAGRFYPMFTPEVLLVIAYVGGITLFVAATIAMVATDLKKVLAYSTISQLGYMMLGLGVFGWAAGLFHLVTHAFFKSLMFLCSGSVIAGCHHEQEMTKMGGLLKKMPITGLTMLVGVIAIAGLSIPGTQIAFSGFFSKDAIVATSLTFFKENPSHFLLFVLPLITAGLTAFYMFRLWFYTFLGKPRDQHVYDHCHESPWVMTGPLIVLSLLAAFCAVGGEGGKLFLMLDESRPAGVHETLAYTGVVNVTLPGHTAVASNHHQAGNLATIAAFLGTLIAFAIYGIGLIKPEEIKKSLAGIHGYLTHKWYFDEIYDVMFVRPAHAIAHFCTAIDRVVFDGVLHWLCRAAVAVARWDRIFDERVVDGLVNLTGSVTYSVGRSFRKLQTGNLRQYVMFIALSVLLLSVILFVWFPH